jgi:hypothetical protein
VTASSPLAAFEPQPTIFASNGDYLVAQARPTGGVNNHTFDVEVRLFGETGVLDSGFSSTPFEFGTDPRSTPQALAVQKNGQVVVAGDGLARLDTNGELDTTFGNGGSLTVNNTVNALLIDRNGDILAIEPTGNDGVVVAAYLAK